MTTGEDMNSTQTLKIEVKNSRLLDSTFPRPKPKGTTEPQAASDESTAYSPFLITQSKAGVLHRGTTTDI